jgi:hypothetical protein
MFARHSVARDASSANAFSLLAAIGLGAALMYLFDPQAGRRRRALLRDRYVHLARKLEDAQRVVVRDAAQRTRGLIAEARHLVRRDGGADDVILIERVRSAVGRVVSHPHAIEVDCRGGAVTLKGPVLADEVDRLVACVEDVRGVERVDNRLTVHAEAGSIPALRGGVTRAGARSEWMQDNWSPSARTLAGSAGAGLALAGLLRGGIAGLLLGALGAGLFARAASNRDMASLVGIDPDDRGIAVQETADHPGEARSLH